MPCTADGLPLHHVAMRGAAAQDDEQIMFVQVRIICTYTCTYRWMDGWMDGWMLHLKWDIALPKDVKLKVKVLGHGLAVLRLSVIIGWAGSGIGGCMPYKDWGIQINRSGNVSSEPMNRQPDCDIVYHPFISSMMGFQDSDVSKTFRQPKVTMGNLPNVKIITNSSNLKGSSNP